MYPPVGLGQLRVNPKRDLTLAGGRLAIPAGTVVWVPHHAMHNAEHNWDQPTEFLPGARPAPSAARAPGRQPGAGHPDAPPCVPTAGACVPEARAVRRAWQGPRLTAAARRPVAGARHRVRHAAHDAGGVVPRLGAGGARGRARRAARRRGRRADLHPGAAARPAPAGGRTARRPCASHASSLAESWPRLRARRTRMPCPDAGRPAPQADATGTSGAAAAADPDAPAARKRAPPAAPVPGLGEEGEEGGLEGRRRAKRYFPFAEGPRHCVGMSLANITLPATLAVLLARYSFRLAPEARARPPWSASLPLSVRSRLRLRSTHDQACPGHRRLAHDGAHGAAAGLRGVHPAMRCIWVHQVGRRRARGPMLTLLVAAARQMGGPEGVARTEQYTLITGMAKGMLMHAVPRPGADTAA